MPVRELPWFLPISPDPGAGSRTNPLPAVQRPWRVGCTAGCRGNCKIATIEDEVISKGMRPPSKLLLHCKIGCNSDADQLAGELCRFGGDGGSAFDFS